MGDLAQTRLTEKGQLLRLRAYLEDLVQEHVGVRPGHELALAIWYGSSTGGEVHNVLELFDDSQLNEIFGPTRIPLLWKSNLIGPPFADVYATSVQHFLQLMDADSERVAQFRRNPEVLYFDKSVLPPRLIRLFRVVTEPPEFHKGWYISSEQYSQNKTIRNLLSRCDHLRPDIGIVKVYESPDFENCRGLMHIEVNQLWLPLTPNGLRIHTFFSDYQDGRPGYFLFQGGSLYRILKFEAKTAPDYSKFVLEQPADGQYTEVYLRSVHPTQ